MAWNQEPAPLSTGDVTTLATSIATSVATTIATQTVANALAYFLWTPELFEGVNQVSLITAHGLAMELNGDVMWISVHITFKQDITTGGGGGGTLTVGNLPASTTRFVSMPVAEWGNISNSSTPSVMEAGFFTGLGTTMTLNWVVTNAQTGIPNFVTGDDCKDSDTKTIRFQGCYPI